MSLCKREELVGGHCAPAGVRTLEGSLPQLVDKGFARLVLLCTLELIGSALMSLPSAERYGPRVGIARSEMKRRKRASQVRQELSHPLLALAFQGLKEPTCRAVSVTEFVSDIG